MTKIGCVLEGGGMRGAYTAGVLCWCIDQNIVFDTVVGISSGAMYAAMYVLADGKTLRASSIDLAADPRNVGVQAVLREGTPVGYNFLFDQIFYHSDFKYEDLETIPNTLLVGVYDIELCQTIWIDQHDIAREPLYLKAACTLPLAGRAVKIEGKKYMDGGITTMIPIKQAMQTGCEKLLVVTTKDIDYVRKPNDPLTQFALDRVYHKHKKLIRDFRDRTRVYYEEKAQVQAMVDDGKAFLMYPTVKTNVKRFGGTKEEFQLLFDNAYQDCENQKEALLAFLKD